MSKLHAALDALLVVVACLLISIGWAAFRPQQQNVGVALPQGSAVFETSLQSRISASDTSMTLVTNTLRGGETLSGYNCFTIDEGRSDSEFVCGDVSGTTVSNLERGLSFSTGTTTVSSLRFAHRVGANVKITDFPLIQRMRHQLSGTDTIVNILKYASHPTFTATTDIVDKKYVDDTAFAGAGVIDATASARGVGELATTLETASSTPTGSSGVLLIPASNATSTFNPLTAALRVVVTQNNGKIDNYFIATSTLFTNQPFSVGTTTMTGSLTLSGNNSTSNIASTSIVSFTSSTSPTTTWTKKSNLKFVIVEVQAGGGQGGAVGSSDNGAAGAGGGGGGYCYKIIPAASLGSTETVTVGGGGSGGADPTGTGGPSSFGSHCSTTGGGGVDEDTNDQAGTGGTATGGDINRPGQAGDEDGKGAGGNSVLGFGGKAPDSDGAGRAGVSYGGGGSSAYCDGSCSAADGGAGAVGAVIVTEVYY
jgi:hypothetical protein